MKDVNWSTAQSMTLRHEDGSEEVLDVVLISREELERLRTLVHEMVREQEFTAKQERDARARLCDLVDGFSDVAGDATARLADVARKVGLGGHDNAVSARNLHEKVGEMAARLEIIEGENARLRARLATSESECTRLTEACIAIHKQRDDFRARTGYLVASLKKAGPKAAILDRAVLALDGRLGPGHEAVVEASQAYSRAEEHLPDSFDSDDYTLDGAVKKPRLVYPEAGAMDKRFGEVLDERDQARKELYALQSGFGAIESEMAKHYKWDIRYDPERGWRAFREYDKNAPMGVGATLLVAVRATEPPTNDT